jgi:hypothetical protein
VGLVLCCEINLILKQHSTFILHTLDNKYLKIKIESSNLYMQNRKTGIQERHSGFKTKGIDTQDFKVETDREGRFRLWFRNRLMPQTTEGEWTGITVSARSFIQMVDALKRILKEMTGEE